jgi:hypothetical protein
VEEEGEGKCVRGEEYVRNPVVRLMAQKLDCKYQSTITCLHNSITD